MRPDLARRLSTLERRSNGAPRVCWVDYGETQAEALARLQPISEQGRPVLFCSWAPPAAAKGDAPCV